MKESTITLRSGLVIPRLSIGTWRLNASEAKEAVNKALRNGIRYIDTAQEYQNENAVANAIRESDVDKNEIIVSTKLTPREVKDYDTAVEGINKSAIIFSGIGIDIMFIHAEDHWDNAGGEVSHDNIGIVKALLEAKEQGIIKAYGVSNFSVKELQKIKDEGLELPEIVQLPHSIGTRRQNVINFCIENNIQMQSYSPFKNSSTFTEDDVINEIANKYGKTVPEVYLSYAIQTTGSVVFKSLNENHIKTNVNLIPFLKEEDINILNKIKRKNTWRYEGVETPIEDDVRPDSEVIDYIIDNETLLGEKKSKTTVSESKEEQDKDYEIVDDISLENKELEDNKASEKTDEEKKLEEFKEKNAMAYERMKKLRASNKKELESLIKSVDNINIYNINFVGSNQSYSTTKNNLTENLRLRIASTINEQVRTLLHLSDAERYYFYKLIEEDPLTGRYSDLEKKLYENYFIKNPSIETIIKSYEESLNKNTKSNETVNENTGEQATETINESTSDKSKISEIEVLVKRKIDEYVMLLKSSGYIEDDEILNNIKNKLYCVKIILLDEAPGNAKASPDGLSICMTNIEKEVKEKGEYFLDEVLFHEFSHIINSFHEAVYGENRYNVEDYFGKDIDVNRLHNENEMLNSQSPANGFGLIDEFVAQTIAQDLILHKKSLLSAEELEKYAFDPDFSDYSIRQYESKIGNSPVTLETSFAVYEEFYITAKNIIEKYGYNVSDFIKMSLNPEFSKDMIDNSTNKEELYTDLCYLGIIIKKVYSMKGYTNFEPNDIVNDSKVVGNVLNELLTAKNKSKAL